jgi:WD40 repeat protein
MIILFLQNSSLSLFEKILNRKKTFLKLSFKMKNRNSIELILVLASLVCLTNKVSAQNLTLANHTSTVWTVGFTEDASGNRLLASGSADKKINFWSKIDSDWSLQSQIDGVYGVLYMVPLPNNQLAKTLSNKIQIWNVSAKTLVKTLIGHSGSINQLAISPDQQMVASASNDFTSKVWNISSDQCISTMYGHTDSSRSVAFYSNDILITGEFSAFSSLSMYQNIMMLFALFLCQVS